MNLYYYETYFHRKNDEVFEKYQFISRFFYIQSYSRIYRVVQWQLHVGLMNIIEGLFEFRKIEKIPYSSTSRPWYPQVNSDITLSDQWINSNNVVYSEMNAISNRDRSMISSPRKWNSGQIKNTGMSIYVFNNQCQ